MDNKKIISDVFKDKEKSNDKILIAQKQLHKGQLFGNIGYGGGEINLGGGYGLGFVVDNENFVTLQLFQYGIGKPVRTQSWVRQTKTKNKKVKKGIPVKFESVDTIEEQTIL